MILAGDIGGTKCNIALMDKAGLGVRARGAFPSPSSTVRQSRVHATSTNHRRFLAARASTFPVRLARRIARCGLRRCRPGDGRSVHITNLGWGLDAETLERQLGTPHVVLAQRSGGHWLFPAVASPRSFARSMQGRQRPRARRRYRRRHRTRRSHTRWNGSRYMVAPSEGGHCDFAPRTEREIELLRYLKNPATYVSFELVLSGRGFLRHCTNF